MEAFASHTTALHLLRLARSLSIQESWCNGQNSYLLDLIRVGPLRLTTLGDLSAQGATLLEGTASRIATAVSGALNREGVQVSASDVWLTCSTGRNRGNPGPCHLVSTGRSVSDSDICVVRGIPCSSPELTFLQLGAVLSEPELTLVGMELCGIYTVCPGNENQSFMNCRAVTTPERIEAVLNRYAGVRGCRVARAALVGIRANTASPRESQLSALLSTSVARGGLGYRSFVPNAKIDVPRAKSNLVTGHYYLADILFAHHRIVLEYDSALHHEEPGRAVRDRRRRNEVELIGYKVLSVSSADLTSLASVNRLDAQIREMAGLPQRTWDADDRSRRISLMRGLGL